jgi:hypothetical protein
MARPSTVEISLLFVASNVEPDPGAPLSLRKDGL